jgi:hypothetical protein
MPGLQGPVWSGSQERSTTTRRQAPRGAFLHHSLDFLSTTEPSVLQLQRT